MTVPTIADLKNVADRKAAEWASKTPEERQAIIDAQDAEERKVEQERHAAQLGRIRDELLKTIPPRYRDAALTCAPIGKWLDTYLDDRANAKGLLIAGPTGVGKTFQMWAIFKGLVASNVFAVEVVKLVRLLAQLRPGGDSGQDRINALCSVPLLMVDDLGVQKASEWVEERLYEIVDTRYEAMLPTVFTTNTVPDRLHEEVGPRVAGRIIEQSVVVEMKGKDRRMS
jgi:DNA replication protein DnaC